MCVYFFLNFIYIFLERGRGLGRETSVYGCLSHGPIGDLACNPGKCPNWESNQGPFGSQADTQSTEPHEPGLKYFFKEKFSIPLFFLTLYLSNMRQWSNIRSGSITYAKVKLIKSWCGLTSHS